MAKKTKKNWRFDNCLGRECTLRSLKLYKGKTPWDNIYFVITAESKTQYRITHDATMEFVVDKRDVTLVKLS